MVLSPSNFVKMRRFRVPVYRTNFLRRLRDERRTIRSRLVTNRLTDLSYPTRDKRIGVTFAFDRVVLSASGEPTPNETVVRSLPHWNASLRSVYRFTRLRAVRTRFRAVSHSRCSRAFDTMYARRRAVGFTWSERKRKRYCKLHVFFSTR